MMFENSNIRKVLVTGANGFIGRSLVPRLSQRGYQVVAATRQARLMGEVSVGEVNSLTNWSQALTGVDAVIHLASVAHIPERSSQLDIRAVRSTNIDGTLSLARQAIDLGVKRFIFLSSIKALGEVSTNSSGFSSKTKPNPGGIYGITKYEAEQELVKIANASGIELVIIRPPLVYGPGVRGNFASLIRLVNLGFPLPFASLTTNRRSFIGIDNLNDFLCECLNHPLAAGRIFLVSDDHDISTAELIMRISRAIGRPIQLLPLPLGIIRALAKIGSFGSHIDRLSESLWSDITETKSLLAWSPPHSLDEGLARCVHGINSK